MEPKAYNIRGLCCALGVGRTTAFKLLANREFEVFKQGSRTYVTVASVDAYIKRRLDAARALVERDLNDENAFRALNR